MPYSRRDPERHQRRIRAPAEDSDPHTAAERHYAACALRRVDGNSPCAGGPLRAGTGGDRIRCHARCGGRPRRADDQGHVAVRRRARQPCGLFQFRRRAGAHPLLLGPERPRQPRLDRLHGVCDLRCAAPCPLQRADRGSEPPGLGGKFLHGRSGASGRNRRAAADLFVLPAGELCRPSSRSSTRSP